MKKENIHQLTSCAIMAALLCVVGPLTLPIGPVPVSLANFVIYLTIYILGMKNAAISVLVYLLLGAVGMPVFSGYGSGLAKLLGPTGGYLMGDLPLVLVAGFLMEKWARKPIPTMLAMVIGSAVLYTFGTAWFVVMMQCELWYALTVCVFPFIGVDLAKIVVAVLFGQVVRKALVQAKLLK